jgi:hypothetical protein
MSARVTVTHSGEEIFHIGQVGVACNAKRLSGPSRYDKAPVAGGWFGCTERFVISDHAPRRHTMKPGRRAEQSRDLVLGEGPCGPRRRNAITASRNDID